MLLAFFNWFINEGRQHGGCIITSWGLSSLKGKLVFTCITDSFPQNLHMMVTCACGEGLLIHHHCGCTNGSKAVGKNQEIQRHIVNVSYCQWVPLVTRQCLL